MKLIQYFDGHIVINLFGLIIRIKTNVKHICPEVKSYGLNTDADRKNKIVVSLTTFPKRIHIVTKTIKTLLTQTMKPDMIILWLAPNQFPNGEKDLPKELTDLKKYGLTIDWYKDIRSYKKIIPALKKYPDSIIITTDDDICYARDTIESLYKSYSEHPEDIHAHRCDWLTIFSRRTGEWAVVNETEQNMYMGKNLVKRAKTRELYKDIHRGEASYRQNLMGYGAVLYPPHSLYKDVTNEELISKTIPTHDDVWLWAMAVLNGTKTRLVKGYSESINYIEGSQKYGLCKINKKGIGMGQEEAYDIILKEYPQIIDILINEKNEDVKSAS